MAYDEELHGVGGWLAFFVVVMAVITPVAAVALMANSLYGDPMTAAASGPIWSTIQLFEWSLVILSIALAWFVSYRLFYVQVWSSVRIAIAGIWLIGLGGLIVEFIGVSLIAGLPLDQMMAEVGREFVRPIVFGLIWTSYFLRSRRVANTYRSAEDTAEVFE